MSKKGSHEEVSDDTPDGEIVRGRDSVAIPLFSSRPQAGFAVPGDDHVEYMLNIHDFLVQHPASTFFVRVEGDSMEGFGILSGDILVVDRSREVVDGSIVVAAVNGELLVKQLRRTGVGYMLMSGQVGYEPITVSEEEDCFVWGVVVGSARQYA